MNEWSSKESTITMGITIQREVSNYCAKQETALLNAGRDDKFLTLRGRAFHEHNTIVKAIKSNIRKGSRILKRYASSGA